MEVSFYLKPWEERSRMRKPPILLATWNDGLFAIENDQCTNALGQQSVRGLASDGFGGALAIVGNHKLCRRGPDGKWTTIATSEIELSCCIAVGNAIYIGTDDAQMLRLSENRSRLEVLDGFNKTAGRQTWFAGSAVVDGQRLGPPWVFARLRQLRIGTRCSLMCT